MALNAKILIVGLLLIGGNSAFAKRSNLEGSDYYTVKSLEIREIKSDYVTDHDRDPYYFKQISISDSSHKLTGIENVGVIIGTIRELVALGEDIYRLVIKGKPTNTTEFAPISVIPKINNEPVDIFSTENWKMPIKKTYEARYVNLYGMDVVVFRYAVVFAYGGSYEGKGAYLTAVQVVPEHVSTMFGYDFTAKMKLGGIQNNGTKENPVAAATLLMEHTVKTVMKAHSQVDTFYVTGNGGFKRY